ncbi:beta-phosphoglucomutase [Limosilactobacillus antri]|uniref:Beta-phosphoglucomutase n=1 Tax=Limosilactobacillus antri DSM 16041 TaxID=525309 RepID=C8P4W6_9LACO|nr:beta-phosphoglucomutase [Limosilactobacillus antri]EEW54472.1 beta-phosphoglucomutase [Limosilactobacillus antri DSM 16041]KRK60131.1 beta-phosphoglucomutase [Limosilactobacillus antri DSM 16041]
MKFEDLKGFAFDLDGVIADTARFHGQAWHQLADKVGTEWTPELADSLKGVSRMDSLELILKAGGHENDYTQEQKEALATEKNDNYIKLVETLTPADILPGMKNLLDELKDNGYHIVLASASKNAPKVLKYLQITDYFEGIVDPAKLSHGKPDPEIYSEAAKLMNLPANQVAGLEDAQAGVESINRAGEVSIGFGASLKDAAVKFDNTSEVSLAAIKEQMA